MKNIAGALLLFLGLSAASQAATIGFNPGDSFADLNDIFTIDIIGGDFFPETQGGGVNLFYDATVVNVLSVSIDSLVWNFTNDEGIINNFSGVVNDVLVSAFNGTGSDPSGSFVVATIEFQAVGPGISALSMTESSVNPWASGGAAVNPTFLTGSVTVSAVPLPAALWLFLSALFIPLGMRPPR
jgi:hypothetical protein